MYSMMCSIYLNPFDSGSGPIKSMPINWNGRRASTGERGWDQA